MTPEAILQDHYAKDPRGAPVNLVAYPHVPGFYRAEWASGLDYALVQDGALVTAKGVDALAAYMKQADLLAQPDLNADDVVTLVQFFGAWASEYLADGYYMVKTRNPQLLPTFERVGDAGRLTLSYLQPPAAGAVAKPNLRDVTRAILEIPRTYQLAWRAETTKVDVGAP